MAGEALLRLSVSQGARRRRVPQHEEGPPPPPWGKFPLVELAVFTGIVLLAIGFFFASGARQAALLGSGLLLASLGGLEVAVREHLGGYRSHTLVLAAVPAVAALAALFYLAPSGFAPIARLAAAGAIFALAAWGLTALFKARSGGYAFRIKPEKTQKPAGRR